MWKKCIKGFCGPWRSRVKSVELPQAKWKNLGCFWQRTILQLFLMIDFTDFQTKIDKESPVHGSFYLTVNCEYLWVWELWSDIRRTSPLCLRGWAFNPYFFTIWRPTAITNWTITISCSPIKRLYLWFCGISFDDSFNCPARYGGAMLEMSDQHKLNLQESVYMSVHRGLRSKWRPSSKMATIEAKVLEEGRRGH